MVNHRHMGRFENQNCKSERVKLCSSKSGLGSVPVEFRARGDGDVKFKQVLQWSAKNLLSEGDE